VASLPKTGTVTYEEWLRLPVTSGREEVVDGEIRVMPPNKLPHARVVQALDAALGRQLDPAATEYFSSIFGLVIRRDPLTCREPDLAVFNRSTMVERDGYVHSAPQLVIEVLSPAESQREIDRKLLDYQAIGTDEVWLIRPEAAAVEIPLLENGRLTRSAILADGTLEPTRFPHVQIRISEIWPD